MSDWRQGFDQAVLAWLTQHIAQRRPRADWGVPVKIVDIAERIDKGFGGSDITAGDDPVIELSITWRDDKGAQHTLSEDMTLTQLIRELDAGGSTS